MTQEAYDGLKAGQPQLVMISLEDSDIEAAGEVDKQAGHLNYDDTAIIQMKRTLDEALKAEVLSSYGPDDVEVVDKAFGLPTVTLRIHSLSIVQRFLDDPRIKGVFVGPIRYYPA